MTKPLLDENFTAIPNSMLDHLMKMNLSSNQYQVLFCIFRKTYGYHKKEERIANFQIAEETGLLKSNVSRAMKALERRKIITRNGKYIGLQKDLDLWEKLSVPITKVISADNNNGDEKLSILQPQLSVPITKVISSTPAGEPVKKKENIKKDIKKEIYKERKIYGEFQNVFLSEDEFRKLKERFGSRVPEMIEALSAGIESKGYKYKNHYAALLSWERREKKGDSSGTHQLERNRENHNRDRPGRFDEPSPERYRQSLERLRCRH
jgi:phage replication O-like protein O